MVPGEIPELTRQKQLPAKKRPILDALALLLDQIKKAQDDLAEAVKNQAPRNVKARLEQLIKNLKQECAKMKKGETHWRQGK